ncbi:hypothetical protein D4R42_04410 [bacterium]|nr:MAG: hypothetical protein D4R42_04410 [bacterium]
MIEEHKEQTQDTAYKEKQEEFVTLFQSWQSPWKSEMEAGKQPFPWLWPHELPDPMEKYDMQLVGKMSDPVATWRPQNLICWYGHVRGHKVLLVVGSDEGIYLPAGIEVGHKAQDVVDKMMRDGVSATLWQLVREILPEEITQLMPPRGELYDCPCDHDFTICPVAERHVKEINKYKRLVVDDLTTEAFCNEWCKRGMNREFYERV